MLNTLALLWTQFLLYSLERGIVSLDTVIKGVCEKTRFMDILENYTLFKEEKNGPIKIIAKNHQYLGVEKSIKTFLQINENKGRLGVFWHTQGSGKTESMIFFSQKILRKNSWQLDICSCN